MSKPRRRKGRPEGLEGLEGLDDLFSQLSNVLDGAFPTAIAPVLPGATFIGPSQVAQSKYQAPDASDEPPAKMARTGSTDSLTHQNEASSATASTVQPPLFTEEQEDVIMSQCKSELATIKIGNILGGSDTRKIVCKSRDGSSNSAEELKTNLFTTQEFTDIAEGASSKEKLKTILFTPQEFTDIAEGASSAEKLNNITAKLKKIVEHTEPFEKLLKDGTRKEDGYFDHQTIAKFCRAAEYAKLGGINERVETLNSFVQFVNEEKNAPYAQGLLTSFNESLKMNNSKEFAKSNLQHKEFVIGVIDDFFSNKPQAKGELAELIKEAKQSILPEGVGASSSRAPAASVKGHKGSTSLVGGRRGDRTQ